MITRRTFLAVTAMAAAGTAWAAPAPGASAARRKFHVCASVPPLEANPELLRTFAASGIDAVWIAGFFYGHWPTPPEKVLPWLERVRQAGMEAHVVNVPLGHPGDSLGAQSDSFPLTPPNSWQLAWRPDGTTYAGTSLHPPATEENAAALVQLEALGVKRVFLDDDFRLAVGPGVIGGCFCDAHRTAFLDSHGYGAEKWTELLDDVRARALTPVLRAWVDFTCGQLSTCFQTLQKAAPGVALGNMIMYLGAEKAGIRLHDYRNAPFRVGELMFNDASFGQLKNKTAELFSCLFHRRFAQPELAFSESTAYPHDQLSAANMAAKLAVSTIADVRNTMFMSGVTPFPLAHWDVLAPAMKRIAAIHEAVAGHALRGPFKHFWGEHSRYVGDDNPYSLFLALGVPFEVVETPADSGWTFVSPFDAPAAIEGRDEAAPGVMVVPPGSATASKNVMVVEESLPAMFEFRRQILPQLADIPHVEEEKPVVCAWYPTARAVVLWNLAEQPEAFTVRYGETRRTVELDALGVGLIEDVSV